MIDKLLTEYHLELGGCKGSSESTYVKMSHCWKSHAAAQLICSCTCIYLTILFYLLHYMVVKYGALKIVTLSDLYIQEWNEKANVSSKGKHYLLFKDNLNFEKYLINVSTFFYSKIIKYRSSNASITTYRTGNHRLDYTTDNISDMFTCDFFKE